MDKVRSFVLNLVLLGVLCLVVEQTFYCLLVPGYFFQLMVSPVFWGGFSASCFCMLWWINLQGEVSSHSHNFANEEELTDYDFMYDDPLSMANPDNMFVRNWGWW